MENKKNSNIDWEKVMKEADDMLDVQERLNEQLREQSNEEHDYNKQLERARKYADEIGMKKVEITDKKRK